jgi:prophage regulatory protein
MAAGHREVTRVLRLPQVRARVGLCRSSLYADIAAGTFPAPVKLGRRSVGWLESEIEQWLADRIERRRKPAAPRERSATKPDDVRRIQQERLASRSREGA